MVWARLDRDDHVDTEVTVFRRVVRWQEWVVSCEANPECAAVLEAVDLREILKSLSSLGAKGVDKGDVSLLKVLGDERTSRSLVTTINLMATARPDLHFACEDAIVEKSSVLAGTS